jgi:hypothetical protein
LNPHFRQLSEGALLSPAFKSAPHLGQKFTFFAPLFVFAFVWAIVFGVNFAFLSPEEYLVDSCRPLFAYFVILLVYAILYTRGSLNCYRLWRLFYQLIGEQADA